MEAWASADCMLGDALVDEGDISHQVIEVADGDGLILTKVPLDQLRNGALRRIPLN